MTEKDKLELMRRFEPFGREIPKDQVMSVIARVPTTDRPKGKWIVSIIGGSRSDMIGDCIVACSQCGEEKLLRSGREKWNFCSNCGADMRGEDE